MMRTVKKPSEILVYYSNKQLPNRAQRTPVIYDSALGPAFSNLLSTGLFSDIEITVNGESLHAHKCILTARSEKFNVMLLSESTLQMQEQQTGKIVIDDPNIKAESFKLMLQWLYTGECEISDSPDKVIPLLQLTDEYLLPDLQKVCEDQIIDYMDAPTSTRILTDLELVLPQKSEREIKDAAKSVFLEEYEKMLEQDPDLEEKVFKVRGLMSELLTHRKKKVKTMRRRRGQFFINDDLSQKKKVRFNISSTIYEDASTLYDEEMSIIETLSV